MIELFIIQYVLVTAIAFSITEKYPPSWVWSSNDKVIRFLGCMIPIYREIIILIVLWQRNEIQKNKHV